MKVFCKMFWALVVAITIKICKAEFLLVEVDDATEKVIRSNNTEKAREIKELARQGICDIKPCCCDSCYPCDYERITEAKELEDGEIQVPEIVPKFKFQSPCGIRGCGPPPCPIPCKTKEPEILPGRPPCGIRGCGPPPCPIPCKTKEPEILPGQPPCGIRGCGPPPCPIPCKTKEPEISPGRPPCGIRGCGPPPCPIPCRTSKAVASGWQCKGKKCGEPCKAPLFEAACDDRERCVLINDLPENCGELTIIDDDSKNIVQSVKNTCLCYKETYSPSCC